MQEISQQVCLPRSCWDLTAESMPKSGTEKAKRPAHHTSRWSVQDERRRGFVQRWTMCTMARIPVCHFALGQGSALTAQSTRIRHNKRHSDGSTMFIPGLSDPRSVLLQKWNLGACIC